MAEARSERTESERYRAFTYDEIVARDKTNVDTAWLRDESLEDMVSSLAPAILAREIVEDLTAALSDSRLSPPPWKQAQERHCRSRTAATVLTMTMHTVAAPPRVGPRPELVRLREAGFDLGLSSPLFLALFPYAGPLGDR